MTFGDYHVIFLHFPIVWITTAFICDFIFLFKRSPGIAKTADGLILAAAITAIPTIWTGLVLSGSEVTDSYLLYHRNWALATFVFTIFHSILRGNALYKNHFNPNFIFLSAINLALIDITADFGGEVAFGKGVFF